MEHKNTDYKMVRLKPDTYNRLDSRTKSIKDTMDSLVKELLEIAEGTTGTTNTTPMTAIELTK
jgi:hypothetical protein